MTALIALSLLGCTDPEPVALAACQAVPGLSIDAAGRAMLDGVLTDEELGILDAAEPTLGLQTLGEAGMKEIRAKTTCVVTKMESAGASRWAATISRTAPSVTPEGALGDPVETELTFQIVDVDGGRAEIGMKRAAAQRASIAEALAEEDYQRFASSWRALERNYPDPVLPVDVAAAEALEARMDYRKSVELTFKEAGDGMVQAEALNTGDKPVASALLSATFEGSDESPEATVGALPPGEVVAWSIPIPAGAEGNVKLTVNSLEFAE